MKRKIVLFIGMLIFMALSVVLVNTNVYADDTYIVKVNNVDELLAELKVSKKRNENDTRIYKIVLNSQNNPYIINAHLSIPSNTCLDLNGNTITYNYINGVSQDKEALYIGQNVENVEIINGTVYGAGFRATDAQKIKLKNIKFESCVSIGISIKKTRNIEISNIEVNNLSNDGIFIENCIVDVFDHITCKNVNIGVNFKTSTVTSDISNCVMQNTKSHGMRIYSSHVKNIKNNTISNCGELGIYLMAPVEKEDKTPIENNDYGSSAENIEHNKIQNCKSDGIGIYHGSWCKEIIYNEIDTIGGNHNGMAGDYGIILDSMMKAKTYCTRIAYNTIKNVTYCGIAVYSGPSALSDEWHSLIYKDTAYVEKNIEYNTFINCGTYKNSEGWKDEFKQGCLSAIYIDTHALVKGDICNNTIQKNGENGIYLHVFSSVSKIYNNNISNCKEFGIHIYQNSTVRGNIQGNTIYNCGKNGIAVSKKSEVKGKIKLNNIEKVKENGIYIKDSVVNNITGNTLKNIKNIGICLNEKATAVDIGSNDISINNVNFGLGIFINGNSKVRNINKNNIKGKMNYAIKVVDTFQNIQVNSNTVSTSSPNTKSFTGIYVSGNQTYKATIKKNAIKGNKTNYGIRLAQGKADIASNTVSKSTWPIYVEKNDLAVTIKDNTLSKNTSNLIRTQNERVNTNNIKISSIKEGKNKKVNLKFKSTNNISKFEIYQSNAEARKI